ncbi:MAG: peptidylprolyl isomerase [Bryobacteraceae bacterium]|nr:peptidylprolyl isomerase [Bryobacteraceae bacterium]
MSEHPPTAPRSVQPGDAVRIHYTCRLDDGTIFATTRHQEPLAFTVGHSPVIPGLQEAVVGLKPGETRTCVVPPERAYGPYHQEMTAVLARDMIPPDLAVEKGTSLRVRHADGHESDVLVTAVTETTVSVDGNHPLAGRNLTLEVELLSVEEA